MTEADNEELASLPSPVKKKDKKAIIDEVITDALMEQFFELLPPAGVERDYHMLERAYRGLPAADFARFIDLFVSRKHNINSKGPYGTMLDVISTHRKGGEYAAAIKKYL
jgi:hypothetical protein